MPIRRGAEGVDVPSKTSTVDCQYDVDASQLSTTRVSGVPSPFTSPLTIMLTRIRWFGNGQDLSCLAQSTLVSRSWALATGFGTAAPCPAPPDPVVPAPLDGVVPGSVAAAGSSARDDAEGSPVAGDAPATGDDDPAAEDDDPVAEWVESEQPARASAPSTTAGTRIMSFFTVESPQDEPTRAVPRDGTDGRQRAARGTPDFVPTGSGAGAAHVTVTDIGTPEMGRRDSVGDSMLAACIAPDPRAPPSASRSSPPSSPPQSHPRSPVAPPAVPRSDRPGRRPRRPRRQRPSTTRPGRPGGRRPWPTRSTPTTATPLWTCCTTGWSSAGCRRPRRSPARPPSSSGPRPTSRPSRWTSRPRTPSPGSPSTVRPPRGRSTVTSSRFRPPCRPTGRRRSW